MDERSTQVVFGNVSDVSPTTFEGLGPEIRLDGWEILPLVLRCLHDYALTLVTILDSKDSVCQHVLRVSVLNPTMRHHSS